MGLMDGGITAIFGAAFGTLYADGSVIRRTRVELPGGAFSWSDPPQVQACKLQREALTYGMRQEAGYTDRDVRLLILAEGVDCPTLDDQVIAYGVTYSVASVNRDPASSYWDVRGTPA